MDPIITITLDRFCRLPEIESKVSEVLKSTKQNNVDLVVVIIPDFPPGVYGILFVKCSLYFCIIYVYIYSCYINTIIVNN